MRIGKPQVSVLFAKISPLEEGAVGGFPPEALYFWAYWIHSASELGRGLPS
jgi:hypothetical protein